MAGPSFYNQADQDLYAGGLQYIPQERYRLGLGNNNQVNRLDFNDLSKSGIMSQAPMPYIYPPINQGGGGGGGFNVTESADQSTTSDDFGLGLEGDGSLAMSEEEQEAIDNMNNPTINKTALAKIGLSSLLGPTAMFGTAYRERQKAKAEALENAQRAATTQRARENEAAGTGGYQSDFSQDKDFMGGSGTASEMGSFATGGRVNYKVGGRTDAESQYGSDSVGSYDSSANQSGRDQSYGNNNQLSFNSGDKNILTTDLITKDPSITFDYTDPRNYASIYSKIGFNNILDNDDLTAEGNLTGELGPINYDVDFTDQGITGTNLKAGNFNANISPDMQLQDLSYNRGPFSISTDGQNIGGKFSISYKNGGLASIL
jgi:hypothetical protein